MAPPVAGELASLTSLDRSFLHVFVAGPGTGEGIALALPQRGWVLIDGCRSDEDSSGEHLPLRWLVQRFRGPPEEDPVQAMVLTHPHGDHADGFGELVVELDPELVGVASPDPPQRTLLDLFEEAVAAQPYDAEADRRNRQVEVAFKAMNLWEDRRGSSVTALRDGISWRWGQVEMAARAPTAAELAALLSRVTPRNVGRVANRMSLVFEVTMGDLRLVLGGDMPSEHGGSVVPEGWGNILGRHPDLARAVALKVPHHGSREALHDGLLAGEPADRCWWVTPFARSALPRGQRSEARGVVEGMTRLLGHQERVQVTALPTRRARQRHVPPPGYVTQSEWNEAFQAKDLAGPFAKRALEVGPAPGALPGQPLWGAAFDAGGRWAARWRGEVAMDVVRDAVV